MSGFAPMHCGSCKVQEISTALHFQPNCLKSVSRDRVAVLTATQSWKRGVSAHMRQLKCEMVFSASSTPSTGALTFFRSRSDRSACSSGMRANQIQPNPSTRIVISLRAVAFYHAAPLSSSLPALHLFLTVYFLSLCQLHAGAAQHNCQCAPPGECAVWRGGRHCLHPL